jgi:hypothetical protein
MQKMILVSLWLNLFVLAPVCLGLLVNAGWALESFGAPTPARGILLSIYLAIGVVSAYLLRKRDARLVAPLLLVQVVYKVTTPFTVGTLANPVVISNLLIAAVHAVTLALIARAARRAEAA